MQIFVTFLRRHGGSMDLKLLLSPDEACKALSVKRSTLFDLLKTGEIPSIKVGRLRRIPAEWLRVWVQKQVEEQRGEQGG
jgi:excisionase family DNA binding protein